MASCPRPFDISSLIRWPMATEKSELWAESSSSGCSTSETGPSRSEVFPGRAVGPDAGTMLVGLLPESAEVDEADELLRRSMGYTLEEVADLRREMRALYQASDG